MKQIKFRRLVCLLLMFVPSIAFRPGPVTLNRRHSFTSSTVLYTAIESSKDDLKTGYKLGKYMLAGTGAFLLTMPDRTARTMVATKIGSASGFGLAAALCYIL